MKVQLISVDEMHDNLIRCWQFVTPLQLHRGMAWYPQAHDFAHVIGRGDVRKGAGILAALSPQKQWDVNRRIAVDASMGIFGGQVANAVNKARAIYDGADPATVLPMSKKTGHFYMNIFNPLDPNWVTIDRHAMRAATLDWDNGDPRITDKQYGDYVLAYRKGAADVGVIPSVFQAAIWGYARERI